MIESVKKIVHTGLHVIQGSLNALDEGVTYAENAIVANSFVEQVKLRESYMKSLDKYHQLNLKDYDPMDNPLRKRP